MLGGEEEACVAIKGRTHSLRDGTVVGLNSGSDTNLHEIKGHRGLKTTQLKGQLLSAELEWWTPGLGAVATEGAGSWVRGPLPSQIKILTTPPTEWSGKAPSFTSLGPPCKGYPQQPSLGPNPANPRMAVCYTVWAIKHKCQMGAPSPLCPISFSSPSQPSLSLAPS